MYYGIKPVSIRTRGIALIESEDPLDLLLQGCTGIFVNSSDAYWVKDMVEREEE